MSDLPDEAAAPASEAVAPSEPEVSGLGSKEPKDRAAALSAMRDLPIGDEVIDDTRERNAEANREAALRERFDPKKHDGTVTYGKGVPHVTE